MLIGGCTLLGGDATLVSYPEFSRHISALQIP
jgi:hypothetical protein